MSVVGALPAPVARLGLLALVLTLPVSAARAERFFPQPPPHPGLPQPPFRQFDPGNPSSSVYSLGVFGQFAPQGLLIQKVVPNSPADRGGLIVGDVVRKIDGVIINSQQQLDRVLDASGGVIQVVVQRKNGQVQNLAIPLGLGGVAIHAPYCLGVRGAFAPNGMSIHTVYDGSPAARVGLKAGDQLLRINNRVIGSQQEFFHALHSSSGKAVLQVRRAGKLHEVNVVLQLARFGTLGTYLANGIRIDLLHPNTPASRAGVGPNDFILSVDNRVVANQAAFEAALDQSGGTWLIKVNKVGAGIGVLPIELMNNSLGCWCEPAVGGMRLLNSPQGTFANRLGLVKGDIIFQVDNRATQNLGALQDAFENARGFMTLDYRSALTGQVGRLNINLSNHFR